MESEHKFFYPHEWESLAHEVKAANNYQCQSCNQQCRRPGDPFDTHKRTLALAHITQDYFAAEVQVAPLCSDCHLRFDAGHSWLSRWRWRHFRQAKAGQLPLLALQ